MGAYEGALVSGMIYLGDEMGLYRAMQGQGPITSDEVAARAGLHERFVREWLSLQAAAGLIEYEGDGLFHLSPEAGLLLAEEDEIRDAIRNIQKIRETVLVVNPADPLTRPSWIRSISRPFFPNPP